jgi:hypothetical protein
MADDQPITALNPVRAYLWRHVFWVGVFVAERTGMFGLMNRAHERHALALTGDRDGLTDYLMPWEH